jgi:WD40 repeat protein/energy-coupling factor transporter ATP-binding protein EcfA2
MQDINHSGNPFPGLRPFESSETHLFFGRDGQSEELLRRLKRTRFLAVVGTSGSGKSSLVRAGLLPALQGGLMASAGSDWRIAIMRPGSDPIGNLARAVATPDVLGSRDEKSGDIQAVMAETTLRRSSLGLVELVSRARTKLDQNGQPLFHDYENLLVVVDQFEELFRFKQLIEEENSKEDAAAFVKLLLEAAGQKTDKIYVVLTMRSDFLGDCSQFWELPEAINNGQYLIPRMTRDERREAISGPVAVGHGAISEPLINQLLNDVGDKPDQLPILQHALMRTWDHWLSHRNGQPMDIADYLAIGGMTEALSRHAEEAYAELSDSQKAIAEKLFKGLTEKGTDNREIRRPMEVGEICELTEANEAAVIAVIEVFRREGRSFLMPPPADALTGERVPLNRESLIDISHESLIRNWERLKTWVDDESRSARIYRRLAETAVLHKEGGASLWRDPDLGIALAWREQSSPNEVWARRYNPDFRLAMSFLDESVSARDALVADENARRQREIRRTRLTAFIFAIAFLFSLAMGGYAYTAKAYAEAQTRLAKESARIAEDERNKAELARAAAVKDQARAEDAERSAATRAEEAERERKRAAEQTVLAQSSERKAVAERQRAETEADRATRSTQEAIAQIAENRKRLYASSIGLAQKALEENNAERAQKLLERARILNKDTGSEQSFVKEAQSYQEIPTEISQRLPGEVKIKLSPWETVDTDMRGFEWYYLWRLASRKLSTHKLGEGASSAEQQKPVPRPDDDPLAVYTARPIAPVAFGDEFQEQFIAAGSDNVVRMWVGNSAAPMVTLPVQQERIKAVAIVGLYKFVTGDRSAIKVWALPIPDRPEDQNAPPTVVRSLKLKGNDSHMTFAVLPHKNMLAIGSGSTFMLWDLSKQQPVTLADGGDGYPSVCFVENGEALITSDGRSLTRWNVRTRQASEIKLLARGSEPMEDEKRPFITSFAFTPDGRKMVTSSNRNFIMWTAANAEGTAYKVSTEMWAHRENFFSRNFFKDLVVAISPDGKLLATGDGVDLINGGGVKVWKITGTKPAELFTLSPDVAYATSLAFSNDSRTLAVGSDNALQLWDVSDIEWRWSPSDYELDQAPATIRKEGFTNSALSPDGRLMALSGSPSEVGWWATNSDPSLRPGLATIGDVFTLAIAFSPDGKLLAVGGGGSEADNGVVSLWDTRTRKEIKADIKGHKGVGITVEAVAFSPDNKTLATGGTDKTIELWDVSSTPARLLTPPLEGHKIGVTAIAYSPDGKTIASGDYSGTVHLWSTSSYQLLLTLKVSEDGTRSVAFSADGNTLYTRDRSGKVLMWPATPRKQVERLLQRASTVTPYFDFDDQASMVAAKKIGLMQFDFEETTVCWQKFDFIHRLHRCNK